MLITKHSFFDLGKYNIPTAEWEEYYGESQLQEEEYLIGVLKNSTDTQYEESKSIKTKEKQLSYIKELQRKYGKRATIIIQAVPRFLATGCLVISPASTEITGILSPFDEMVVRSWAVPLSENYLFNEPITVTWGKVESTGALLVRSIS